MAAAPSGTCGSAGLWRVLIRRAGASSARRSGKGAWSDRVDANGLLAPMKLA